MRLLIATVLAAGPLLGSAQSTGDIAFSQATINAAECKSGSDETLGLSWELELESGELFVTTGEFRVYASNKDYGGTSPYCYREDDATDGAFAAELSTVPATIPATSTSVTSVTVLTADVAAAAGHDCTADETIYVCVLWYDTVDGVTPTGWAKGSVSVKVDAPLAPEVTAVDPGENALYVKITETAGDVETDEVRAKAVVGAEVHYSSWQAYVGSPVTVRIGGLQNGVGYLVTAAARSAEDNESPWSDPPVGPVEPVPVLDGWERYKSLGGRDTGGCQAGAAELLALLGAAALLRLRRRS